jgi:hypothetical protein
MSLEKVGGPLVRPTSESKGKNAIHLDDYLADVRSDSREQAGEGRRSDRGLGGKAEVIAGLDLKLSGTLGSRRRRYLTVSISGAERECIGRRSRYTSSADNVQNLSHFQD